MFAGALRQACTHSRSPCKITGGAVIAGDPWRDSLATGALMNARGLVERIVMKIGLDAGLIGPELFTILLVMAWVTTAMTTPLMTLLSGVGHDQRAKAPADAPSPQP